MADSKRRFNIKVRTMHVLLRYFRVFQKRPMIVAHHYQNM